MAGGVPGAMTVAELREHIDAIPLIDHHVHGTLRGPTSRSDFENALNEADTAPLADPSTAWDSQLGFAVRRWCAEELDLPRHVSPDEYWRRRSILGEHEVSRRLLAASGVSDWVVDTGFAASGILTPPELAAAADGKGHEIIRLEPLAEEVILDGADGYAARFASALAERAARPVGAARAVGTKSIIAYRSGFDVDLSRPAEGTVADAARRWHEEILADSDPGSGPRLVDPVLLVHGLYAAIDLGLPLQLHVGFGDRDLDLRRADPLLLLEFLRSPGVSRVPVLLLHCYPYERQAGFLAQAFGNVYLDVGLATHFLGARGSALIARSLELAPFGKLLYSSDGYGPAELHHLGARLWRNGMAKALGDWVAADEWSLADAKRVAELVGRDNAARVYGL